MRISVLSRSLVATASLAVASATLAAVPASAATPSGITRDQVLAATAGVRAEGTNSMEYSLATNRALRVLANRACAVNPDTEVAFLLGGLPVQAGGNADGLMVMAAIIDPTLFVGSDEEAAINSGRACVFGAVAAADPTYSLTGTTTLSYITPSVHALSGDVYVTPARNLPLEEAFNSSSNPSFSASGNATKTIGTKVSTPKTTKQKKAAKKAYDQALKSAKKSYTKALKKADGNKKKKAAAKKAYNKKKATAKAKYTKAIATFKIVNHTDARPFSLLASIPTMPMKYVPLD